MDVYVQMSSVDIYMYKCTNVCSRAFIARTCWLRCTSAGDGRRLPTQRNAELKTGLNGPRSEEEIGGCCGELRLKVGL
jgi:hypothetical protein